MIRDDVVLVDTHCHLDLFRDQEAVLEGAAKAGVPIVAMSNRPTQYRNLRERFGHRPNLELGLGFHPEAAGSPDEPHELLILRDHFSEARWIAEVGLDGYFTGVPTLEKQQKLLEQILQLGVRDKLMVVHSRGAADLLVDMLSDAGASAVIMHWYSGSRQTGKRALDLGYYFSANPGMLEAADEVEVAKWIPSDRLLLETDGPFVTYQGRPVQPADVESITRRLAETRGASYDELAEQISANFRNFVQMGAGNTGAGRNSPQAVGGPGSESEQRKGGNQETAVGHEDAAAA